MHDYAFDGAFLNHGLLWQVPVMSLIHCAIRCAENRACISLHFHIGVRKCRGYETLMLTPQAGTNEEGWIYYYSTQKGICPHGYAYTRVFDYCVGYEGHFTDDVGFQKCREKSGRYMLIHSPEENRFASLLAYNFDSYTDFGQNQMRIQGSFNSSAMAWQDDFGLNLNFTQLIPGKEIPSDDSFALYLKNNGEKENFKMTCRRGNRNPSAIVCVISDEYH